MSALSAGTNSVSTLAAAEVGAALAELELAGLVAEVEGVYRALTRLLD